MFTLGGPRFDDLRACSTRPKTVSRYMVTEKTYLVINSPDNRRSQLISSLSLVQSLEEVPLPTHPS